MQKTSIEWSDYSSNPIYVVRKNDGKRGWACTKVSDGCKACYAETINKRLGTGFPFAKKYEDEVEWRLNVKELAAWFRHKAPGKCFVADMTDLFHPAIPDSFKLAIIGTAALTSWKTYQFLTKRAYEMRTFVETYTLVDCLAAVYTATDESPMLARKFPLTLGRERLASQQGWPPKNTWWGVSVESPDYLWRVDELLKIPAAVRFISAEPLLGPIDFRRYFPNAIQTERGVCLSSGPERRSSDPGRRNDLANTEAGMGSLEAAGCQSPMQADSGGTRQRRILPSSHNDRQGTCLCPGAPSSLSPFQGVYSGGSDSQSRERDEEGQSSRQSRSGNVFRATDPRYSHIEGGARLQSGRREELDGKGTIKGNPSNSEEASKRREAKSDSSRLRYLVSGSVEDRARRASIDLIIIGGESGSNSRPCNLSWIRSIVLQCQAAGVKAFVKQWGSVPVMDESEWRALPRALLLNARLHKRAPQGTVPILLDDPKGGDISEFPDDLKVRQFPA